MVDQISSIHKALDSIPSTTNKLETTEEVLLTIPLQMPEGFGAKFGELSGCHNYKRQY